MLMRMHSNWNSQRLLVGIQTEGSLKNSLTVSLNIKHHVTQKSHPRKIKTRVDIKTCTWMFIAALFQNAPQQVDGRINNGASTQWNITQQ